MFGDLLLLLSHSSVACEVQVGCYWEEGERIILILKTVLGFILILCVCERDRLQVHTALSKAMS